MKTPVNGKTLRRHLTYSWWKYALVIIIGALAVNLLYTVTAYRSPAEKKIDVYIYGYGDEKGINAYMNEIRLTKMSDMEEMNALLLTMDESYGAMQLSTYIAAAEGDVYILPRDEFVSFAVNGAWIPLEDYPEITTHFTERDISLQSGWRRESESGESHLYGIPVSKLPGLSKYLYVENGYICVLVTNGNDENVVKFLSILCEDMIEDAEVSSDSVSNESKSADSDPAQTDSSSGEETASLSDFSPAGTQKGD